MIINHNMNALNAHRQMMGNVSNSGKSMEKLSSGLRINRAGDDAAGLAISEKMRGQIRGLDQATKNSQDGISMLQTAEGSLNETHSILQRMRELATQASNDTNTGVDRGEIQKEMNQLTSEINRIGNTTEFNTQKLLNGERTQHGATSAKAAVSGIAGVYTLAASAIVTGKVVGGLSITTAISGNKTKIASALNNDATFKAKFTAVATGTNVKITAKATHEADALTATTGLTITTVTSGKAAVASAAAIASSVGVTFQIGANGGQGMVIEVNDMRAFSTGTNGLKIASTSGTTVTSKSGKVASYTSGAVVTNGTDSVNAYKALDVSSNTKATAAIDVLNDAIQSVSAERSKLGAYQNRLEHTITNLGTASENLTASESRIRDVDMAKEMMNFSKNNILSQASQAMLAQAKSQPEAVLQLLR